MPELTLNDERVEVEWHAAVERELETTRARTHAWIATLTNEQLCAEPPAPMGPLVWDLAHLANYEERWCVRALGGAPIAPELDDLYDAFETPRPQRVARPLLDRAQALDYMARVRAATLAVLRDGPPAGQLAHQGFVFRMIAQHECQHQETLLQGLQLGGEPCEALRSAHARETEAQQRAGIEAKQRVRVPAGPFVVGTSDRSCAWDNERGAHRHELPAFEIDRYPVTNGRWLRFLGDGGYARSEFWSAEGWAWRERESIAAPLGWRPRVGGGWCVERLGHEVALALDEPVQHVSCHEAEAFARWAGGRLPSEAEWEKAAAWDPARPEGRPYPWGVERPDEERANVGAQRLGPAPIGSYPAGASHCGAEQMLGDVYEWTSSSFQAYPGFQAFPYREYSQVFFGRRYRVLRGSSWAAGAPLARTTYRNWDLPERRQLFCGLRLAWDAA